MTSVSGPSVPVTAEIVPGLWRLTLPMPNNFLGSVNLYLVLGDHGSLLVDSGFETTDLDEYQSWQALLDQFDVIGLAPEAIRTVVVTHGHLDHFGLAGRIRDCTGAEIWLHEQEVAFVHHRYEDPASAPHLLQAWLERYGVNAEEAALLSTRPVEGEQHHSLPTPDRLLQGGEEIHVGTHHFTVEWTPGHTPGHVCLLDSASGLLLCGDHVLPKINPNVSLQAYTTANPLPGYLDSLRHIGASNIRLALPGHGDPMTDIATRASEQLQHQLERREALLNHMADTPQTPYQLASKIWANTTPSNWSQFRGHLRRNAIGTLAAHLELLADEGLVRRANHGPVTFSRC